MIPLERAYLCLDCNRVVQPLTAGGRCPGCLGRALLSLARILDRAATTPTVPTSQKAPKEVYVNTIHG